MSYSEIGKSTCIKKIGGTAKSKRRLETLGFTIGSMVTVVSELTGSLIVNVKDSRIAISRELAHTIFV